MPDKSLRKCPSFLAINEIQITVALRFQFSYMVQDE